jgi:hypothetical protein
MNTNRGNSPIPVTKLVNYSPDRAIGRLSRAIALSQGQFSLILVCCNDLSLQPQIVEQVAQKFSGNIYNLQVDQSLNQLYTTIKNTVLNQEPEALMVFGLESVDAIDQLLTSTNFVRGQFGKCFSFPLVLWVNDEIIKKLVRLAPDFKSWATTIRFPRTQPLTEELAKSTQNPVEDKTIYQLTQSLGK